MLARFRHRAKPIWLMLVYLDADPRLNKEFFHAL
jgi:hypothetical protein